jgi:hypothetical protein
MNERKIKGRGDERRAGREADLKAEMGMKGRGIIEKTMKGRNDDKKKG